MTKLGRNFYFLYVANLISEIGGHVTDTVVFLQLYKLGAGNVQLLALSKFCFILSFALGTLFGGPISDLFNRKRVLIFLEFIRIPILIFMFFNSDSPYALIVGNALVGLFSGIFRPARMAIIPELVKDPKKIEVANTAVTTLIAIVHVAGPAIGGLLYERFDTIKPIIALDITSYVFAVIILLPLFYRPKKRAESKINFLSEFKAGINYAKKREDLHVVFLSEIVTGFTIGGLITLILPFAVEVLGENESYYGHLLAAFGAGGIFGGPIFKYLRRTYELKELVRMTYILEPIMMLTWMHITNTNASFCLMGLWGLLIFVRIPALTNYFSSTVEIGFLGRVTSLNELCFTLPYLLGVSIVGFLGANFSAYQMLLIYGLVFLIPNLYLFQKAKKVLKSTKEILSFER